MSVRPSGGELLVAFAAAGLLLTPALAAPSAKRRPPAIALSADKVSQFTPANADPRLAAAFAGRIPLASDLKFTPATSSKRPGQVRVAIRARAATPSQAARVAAADNSAASVGALTPTSYNLGVAIGWRRFAVSGDVAQVNTGNPALGDREGAAVAVSYSLKRFTGRVSASADRGEPGEGAALPATDNYALDLGGAYNVSRNVAVTGGVRYRIERERLSTLADPRRDSQAVYIGTAFKF